MSRPRSWTDDQFRQAVATNTTLIGIASALGLTQGGPTNRVLRAHAQRLGLELPNGWRRPRSNRRRS